MTTGKECALGGLMELSLLGGERSVAAGAASGNRAKLLRKDGPERSGRAA